MNSLCSFKTTNNRYKTTHIMKRQEAERAYRESHRRKDRQAKLQDIHLEISSEKLKQYRGLFKADGTPDKRTKKWRAFHSQNPTFEFVGRRKADVSPDKRTKEWKAFVQSCPSSWKWDEKALRQEIKENQIEKEKIEKELRIVRSGHQDYIEYVKSKKKKLRLWSLGTQPGYARLLTEGEKKFLDTPMHKIPGIKQGNENIKKLREKLKTLSG